MPKIKVAKIINSHYKTFYYLEDKIEKTSISSYLIYIVIPLIISLILTFFGYTMQSEINNLIAAISIFGGFLFNLLAIIYTQVDKILNAIKEEEEKLNEGQIGKFDTKQNELTNKKAFAREINSNISYSIIISITIILFLLLLNVDLPPLDFINYKPILRLIITGINYFLLSHFLLTLLMVLSRVYILLSRDME
jgi:uncharacterized Tic20 family protein